MPKECNHFSQEKKEFHQTQKAVKSVKKNIFQ